MKKKKIKQLVKKVIVKKLKKLLDDNPTIQHSNSGVEEIEYESSYLTIMEKLKLFIPYTKMYGSFPLYSFTRGDMIADYLLRSKFYSNDESGEDIFDDVTSLPRTDICFVVNLSTEENIEIPESVLKILSDDSDMILVIRVKKQKNYEFTEGLKMSVYFKHVIIICEDCENIIINVNTSITGQKNDKYGALLHLFCSNSKNIVIDSRVHAYGLGGIHISLNSNIMFQSCSLRCMKIFVDKKSLLTIPVYTKMDRELFAHIKNRMISIRECNQRCVDFSGLQAFTGQSMRLFSNLAHAKRPQINRGNLSGHHASDNFENMSASA